MNLASSTMVPEGKCPTETLGFVISYSVKVKLNCGTLGGELITDVPFKLMHPASGMLIALIIQYRKRIHIQISCSTYRYCGERKSEIENK